MGQIAGLLVAMAALIAALVMLLDSKRSNLRWLWVITAVIAAASLALRAAQLVITTQ